MIDVKELLRAWSAGHRTGRLRVRLAHIRGKRLGATSPNPLSRSSGPEARARVHRRRGARRSRSAFRHVPLPTRALSGMPSRNTRGRIEGWFSRKRPLKLTRSGCSCARARRGGELRQHCAATRSRELGWRQKETTIRLEDPPAGQEAQLDFASPHGHDGRPRDGSENVCSGRLSSRSASVATSSFGPTFAQTTEASLRGTEPAGSSSGP